MKTKRAFLRSFNLNDLDSVLLLTGDSEVMQFTGFKNVQTVAETQELLLKWSKSKSIWAAIEESSGELIGWFMLKKTILDAPELGFMILKSKWNQGYATEISKHLISFGFENLNEDKIIASANSSNTASIKVLEKLGFTKTRSYSDDSDIQYFETLK